MIDKSLDKFLIVLFGTSGVAILVLAWLWPMPTSERIIATVIGLAGFFTALFRALLFKSSRVRSDVEQNPVKVEVEDKL